MVYTSTLSLFRQIRDEIKPIYGHEADMLAMFIVEDVSGFNSTDILTDHKFQTGPNFRSTILKYILQLKRQEPIQYILGKAYFYENMYEVNENTLIPRPETEELVNLVLDHSPSEQSIKVLDIGVGSGCIATTIALNLPQAKVDGLDVSMSAIMVAERNAKKLGAEVTFIQADIFTYTPGKEYDVIVSNPPYVRNSEKKLMNINVIDYEPAKALFVSDEDPLIFYDRIINFSKEALLTNGLLFFEVNEAFAKEVARTLEDCDFEKIEVVKDINNKDRFVYGVKGT
jgi:release factor glutamine methyltransferase